MWARVIEVLLACWLAVSPFLFRHAPAETFLWITDLSCAVIIALFSLLSYRPRWEKTHLLNLAVAGWLIGTGFLVAESPPPPAIQNHVVIGLLLLMFAVIPSHAERPPRSWQEFYKNGQEAVEP
jgi:hypothetical protein